MHISFIFLAPMELFNSFVNSVIPLMESLVKNIIEIEQTFK